MDEKKLPQLDHRENPQRKNPPLKSKNERFFKNRAPFTMLLIVFSVCAVTVLSFYIYERWLNTQLLEWKSEAESKAFNYKWDEAEKQLEQANETRPGVKGIEDSLAAVRDAKEFESSVEALSEFLEEDDLSNAENEMNAIIEKIESSQNELFLLYKDDLNELRDKSVVLGIQNDIEHSLSMQALAGKLLEISNLENEEAEELKVQIKDDIAEEAIIKAQEKIDTYQFSEAINIVEIGLGYTSDHEDLLSFKRDINEARLAYQTEEYDRMQDAMEEAEREEHFNRTEAVSIKEWEVITSEPGIIKLVGKVENKGSRLINDVQLTWAIFNDEGQLVSQSTVTINPSTLFVNEEGEFKDIIKFKGGETNVEITNITWEVE
ncbi:hypothetical protein [Jeotgalibacillus campisalis]|uniref:Uncharacterized protein n=1 Tax=Jeotgalibacillus campisalis TaxID=220754 RepID=A0A0C2VIE5_9BACL|nr:hypothetical protein [Jeotgalibacillus campisalis]KIL48642.1 hypothetical protein KR50_12270 [Jeotgalibacillus campisalis]